MSAADERALQRRTWPVRRLVLSDDGGGDDLSDCTTPEQRLAMMWELALSAWALTGRELPSYERAKAPGKLVRGADSP